MNRKSCTGKLIAIEGIDGSGKKTQLSLLEKHFESRGFNFDSISFPQYNGSLHASIIARYLNGEFGDVYGINPYLSSLLYAGDRFEARTRLISGLRRGKIILVDRYVGSNLAHQSAKLPLEQREQFIIWLKSIEYGVYKLPKENLVFYLDIPISVAQQQINLKVPREYTNLNMDIHEREPNYLKEVARQYQWLATHEANWTVINCLGEDGSLRKPKEICELIISQLNNLLTLPPFTHSKAIV